MAAEALKLRVKTGEKDGTGYWADCGLVDLYGGRLRKAAL